MMRQAPYADPNVNAYVASQMQHMSAQRVQQNAAMNNVAGRPDSFPAEEEHLYRSSKAEGQWQWDRDANKVSNQMLPHILNEGQGDNGTKSFYQGMMADAKLDLEKQVNKEVKVQPHEQDMEIGYEDNPPSSLTLEGLEKKFLDETMKLAKEQSDAEDVENARHREKIIEINNQYQERLSSLRAKQANRREEFLRKEAQARLQQYQQTRMSQYPINTGLGDARSYGGAGVAAAVVEAPQAYVGGQFESYRERTQQGGRRPTEGRVPYPAGRVYNTGGRYY
ncbi:hypothetical protein L1049_012275 [Liquidambar formosana]|uniref:Uncharacterized protein n=1 Tax=Liquidambar formosana TaxID=63359 RepID=A0AAP0RSU2_LIQFO